MGWKIAFIVAVVGITAVADFSPALSQDKSKEWTLVDLNTLDCRTFLKMTGEERGTTVAFYHGVLTGMKKEMTVNVPLLSEITDKVVDHCIDKPNDILLKVFQEKRK